MTDTIETIYNSGDSHGTLTYSQKIQCMLSELQVIAINVDTCVNRPTWTKKDIQKKEQQILDFVDYLIKNLNK